MVYVEVEKIKTKVYSRSLNEENPFSFTAREVGPQSDFGPLSPFHDPDMPSCPLRLAHGLDKPSWPGQLLLAWGGV